MRIEIIKKRIESLYDTMWYLEMFTASGESVYISVTAGPRDYMLDALYCMLKEYPGAVKSIKIIERND